jgi:hypothetical protein
MFVMDCLCFLPLRVEGMRARELVRVMSDSFVAVLLSWRGRKLLSRQLRHLRGRLLCLGALGFCRHVSPPARVVASDSTHA